MMPTPLVNGRLEIPGLSPGEDRLLAMVAALASELSVTRERLDTLERLVEAAGVIPPGAVEAFAPSPKQSAERDTLRRRLIARIFRPLREHAARHATQGEAA